MLCKDYPFQINAGSGLQTVKTDMYGIIPLTKKIASTWGKMESRFLFYIIYDGMSLVFRENINRK